MLRSVLATLVACIYANAQIRHGNTVTLKFFCISERNQAFYYLPGRSYKNKTCSGDTNVILYKDPYYKSRSDIILSGTSIRIVLSNTTTQCGINSRSKIFECARPNATAPLYTPVRILSKHGSDREELQNTHYVKFRPVGSAVDCNGRTASPVSPFQCKTKTKNQNEYGVVIVKTI